MVWGCEIWVVATGDGGEAACVVTVVGAAALKLLGGVPASSAKLSADDGGKHVSPDIFSFDTSVD